MIAADRHNIFSIATAENAPSIRGLGGESSPGSPGECSE
jgi:hypothetical protein